MRLPADQIHRHRTYETIVLRDRLISLCPLRRVLEIEGSETSADTTDEISVLVVNVDGEEFGLVVDDFRAGTDIILKPLEGILAGARLYSGSALLGDGTILLILNLKELVQCRW